MTGHETVIKRLFLDKPECIINFPEWMLSQKQIIGFREMEGLAIVEMAGRDSVAAAIMGVEEHGFTDLLPTYVYTGTEYGKWESVLTAVDRLKQKLPKKIRVHDLLVFGSPASWKTLNGRYSTRLIKKYGFFTPCIGCHLYLHSMRIPMAVLLGNKPIISGERESHDGRIKINQVSEALDAYMKLSGKFSIPLLMPLRQIKEGSQVEEIIGIEWEQDREQLECVLSGNYRDLEGNNAVKIEDAKILLDEFLVPCAEKIVKGYLDGYVPDHAGIAGRIME